MDVIHSNVWGHKPHQLVDAGTLPHWQHSHTCILTPYDKSFKFSTNSAQVQKLGVKYVLSCWIFDGGGKYYFGEITKFLERVGI